MDEQANIRDYRQRQAILKQPLSISWQVTTEGPKITIQDQKWEILLDSSHYLLSFKLHYMVASGLSADRPWCDSPVPQHSKGALLDQVTVKAIWEHSGSRDQDVARSWKQPSEDGALWSQRDGHGHNVHPENCCSWVDQLRK